MTDRECPRCGLRTDPLVSDVDGSTEYVCPEHGARPEPRNDFAALVGVAVKRVDYVPEGDDSDAGYVMIEFANGATLYADAPSLYGPPAAADDAKCSCEVKGIPGFGPHLTSCPLYEGGQK